MLAFFFPGRYYGFGISCDIRYLFSCLHFNNISDLGLIIILFRVGDYSHFSCSQSRYDFDILL